MRTAQMNLFTPLVVVMALAAAKAGDVFETTFNDCMKETGATQDDFMNFPMSPLKTDKLNCTFKCGMDKFDVMSPDGVLNAEKAFEVAVKIAKIEEQMKPMFKEIVETCASEYSAPVQPTELCKRSAGIVGCIIQKIHDKMREAARNGPQ